MKKAVILSLVFLATSVQATDMNESGTSEPSPRGPISSITRHAGESDVDAIVRIEGLDVKHLTHPTEEQGWVAHMTGGKLGEMNDVLRKDLASASAKHSESKEITTFPEPSPLGVNPFEDRFRLVYAYNLDEVNIFQKDAVQFGKFIQSLAESSLKGEEQKEPLLAMSSYEGLMSIFREGKFGSLLRGGLLKNHKDEERAALFSIWQEEFLWRLMNIQPRAPFPYNKEKELCLKTYVDKFCEISNSPKKQLGDVPEQVKWQIQMQLRHMHPFFEAYDKLQSTTSSQEVKEAGKKKFLKEVKRHIRSIERAAHIEIVPEEETN